MFKKRKSIPKDTSIGTVNYNKKFPLLTIPSVTLNQNRRIQTLPSGESKLNSKTMQLKKQACNSKKTISRKTTSRTNKFQSSVRPICLQQLLKQVRQIKSSTLNETNNKSKSPLSSQSPSNLKLWTKSNSGTLKNKTNRKNSLNISKTLRQLDFTQLFVDQQSNFIYPSASERPINQGLISSSEQLEGINLQEMELFRSAAIPAQRLKVDIKSHDSLQETVAAITIQRAFRKYCTKRLIQRYSQISCFSFNYGGSRILGQSQDFYGRRKQNQTKQISDLQQPLQVERQKEQQENQYQQLVNSLKKEQMQKWNYILGLIANSKGGSFEDTSRLFKQIEKQSQINRQSLLQLGSEPLQNVIQMSPDDVKDIQKQQNINEQSNRIPQAKFKTSSDSQGQYDCKKYIQYLDSDVFPQAQSSSNSKEIRMALGITTISTKKQQALLQSLKNMPKLGENFMISSSSLKNLNKKNIEIKEQPNSARNRLSVKRCTSQKAFRRTLSNLSQIDVIDKIDLKMLQEEFLDQFPLINEPKQQQIMMNNEDNLLNSPNEKPKEELVENEFIQYTKNTLVMLEREEVNQQNVIAQQVQAQRLQEIQCNNKGLLNISRCVNITAMIVQHLQNQLIDQIVSSLRLGTIFREITKRGRPKVRKGQNGKKKKGFPSDKKQIQNFLQNFTNYLMLHHVSVLKNLQISTGPSAIQLLKYMHVSDQSISVHSEEEDEGNIMVIPNKIFDLFWKIKEKSIIVQVPPNFNQENSIVFKQNVQCLKSFNKIFYRVLFDTFNECLDSERNFGVLGRPFPWKKAPSFPHKLKTQNIKDSLKNAKAKMLQIAITYCGLIVDTDDLNVAMGGEQYLLQVQQDRLSKMLATDLIENQRRWHFYDDQQAQILIQISNALYQEILFDVIEDIVDFQ